MLAEFMGVDWLYWWQIPLLILLIVIIIAYVMYRRKQM